MDPFACQVVVHERGVGDTSTVLSLSTPPPPIPIQIVVLLPKDWVKVVASSMQRGMLDRDPSARAPPPPPPPPPRLN